MAGLGDYLETVMGSPLFLGGAALASGEGFGGAMQGMAAGNKFREEARKRQQQEQMKQAIGSSKLLADLGEGDRAIIASNPALAQAVLTKGYVDQLAPKHTEAIRNYDYARKNGYTGSFPDWVKTATASEAPSNVREWQYFNSLPPEAQSRYLNMKRPDKWLDTGMEHVRPNQAVPGGPPMQSIPKAIQEKAIETKTGENIAKTRDQLPEAKQRLTLLEGSLDRLEQGVDDLLRQPGLPRIVGGLYQAKMPNFTPDAVTAQTYLDNLKQKVSGSVLQSMRDMSKTGGAVGNVTEREWPRLENLLGNLEQAQDLPQFKKQAEAIKQYVKQVKQGAREAYDADLRTAVSGPASRTQDSGPPRQAVEFLRTQPTPEMRQFFDQKYGPGASDAVLGGR